MTMETKFDAREAEPRLYAMWEEAGAFKAGANASRPETFCIMIPPPNVTGALHVGHAFNNTIQDILIRWHRMRGYDTLWQPGQDHAGIATQLMVERELAKSGQKRTDFSRDEFLGKVWEWKGKYGQTIINQLKRLGSSCDWSRNAFTMSGAPNAPAGEDGNFHDAVIKVFVEMYNKGLIYRGKRLVNWDPHFETAISDLEVENIEVAGHMWHFKYPLAGGATYEYVEKDEDGNVTLRETRDYISIATTRPETMLGDGAVAVHPSDERYAPIVGMLCEIPVGPKEHRRLIPIITDEYPDPTFGSGAVKITGAHDFNDYQVAKRAGLPMYRLMDTRGAMRADGASYEDCAARAMEISRGAPFTEAEIDTLNLIPEELRGLDRFEARKAVVAQITAEGLAVMTKAMVKDDEGNEVETLVPYVENKPIMQPFGDRSKVVIEPMLTDQWYVDAEKIVGRALDAVRNGETVIMPEAGEKTYYHWLENIEPWCISRQLWWGHQIPVWYVNVPNDFAQLDALHAFVHRQIDESDKPFEIPKDLQPKFTTLQFCAESAEAAEEMAKAHFPEGCKFTELGGFKPGDPWFGVGPLEEDGSREVALYRDPDVLDTWFSSGLWPIGTLGWPNWDESTSKYFPTDVLVTGFDILFFWVARMMMMQLAVVDQIPFHTVYLHQLVRDEKGKKMSKTAGNVIDPLEIIDEYGADALRFTNASMAAIGGVLKLSKDRIAGYRNFGTKIWNATRFAEMNGVFEGPAQPGIPQPSHTVNRWIIGETAKVRETVDAALAGYRFNEAAQALYRLCLGQGLRLVCRIRQAPLRRGRGGRDPRDDALGARSVLYPAAPDDALHHRGTLGPDRDRAKMLVHADWPSYGAELVDADADREMNWVIELIETIRSARTQMGVPVGLKLPMVLAEADPAARTAIARNQALIERLARIDSITETAIPKGAISIPVAGALFGLPLEGVIDVKAEKARLEKSLAKLEKEAAGLRAKLDNPRFIANAAEEVIEESRENLAAREDEAAKVASAVKRLAELG